MLLRDADIEAAIREGLGKAMQAGGIHHCCRDGDHSFVDTAQPEQLLREHIGPVLTRSNAKSLTGLGIDLAYGVEAVFLMVFGSLEAVALPGNAMHQHGPTELLRLLESSFKGHDVMTIYRAYILQAQVGEHALWRQHIFQPHLDAVQDVIGRISPQWRTTDIALHQIQDLLVTGIRA